MTSIPQPYWSKVADLLMQRQSVLVQGAPMEIINTISRYAHEQYHIPTISFHSFLAGKPHDILDPIDSSRIIVENVFDRSSDHSPEQTKRVYQRMRAVSAQAGRIFYMFAVPGHLDLEKRMRDAQHPMFNWNTFSDWSR